MEYKDTKTCKNYIRNAGCKLLLDFPEHIDVLCDGKDVCCKYYTENRNKKKRGV